MQDPVASEYVKFWQEWGVESLGEFERGLALWQPEGAGDAESADFLDHPASAIGSNLDEIRTRLGSGCGASLCGEKRHLVFGEGSPHAKLMFVGASPGAPEDESGRPFSGTDGQLLTKIIAAMGFSRSEVYIATVVKCRGREDRAPRSEEVRLCSAFLRAQIEVVRPTYLVALGELAAQTLTGLTESLDDLRGRLHPLVWDPEIKVMPTYLPAYLLENPAAKRIVWEDMKQLMQRTEAT